MRESKFKARVMHERDGGVSNTAAVETGATIFVAGDTGSVLLQSVLEKIAATFEVCLITPGSTRSVPSGDNACLTILVEPTLQELMAEYASGPDTLPVIVVSGNSAPNAPEAAQRLGIAAYLAAEELGKLPRILTSLASGSTRHGAQQNLISQQNPISQQNIDSLREGQRLITIGKLAGEIAHEINNPLESVGNLIYLAQSEPGLPAAAADYLRDAERELARVVQISKQTLSFYRESNRPTSIEIAALMDEVVSLYGRRLQQKGVSIARQYADAGRITALPGEIRQVLSNLVTNAIEASEIGGQIRVRIRNAHRWADSDVANGIRISICDSGSGIPEAARKRLGELFFTTKGEAGTGLGLWVTKAIIQRYGGTMRLKSNTGEKHGTTFCLFLPFNDNSIADLGPLTSGDKHSSSNRVKRGNVTEISNHPSHNGNLSTLRHHVDHDGWKQHEG